MRFMRVTGTAAVCLFFGMMFFGTMFFGTMTSVWAQQDDKQDKPDKQPGKKDKGGRTEYVQPPPLQPVQPAPDQPQRTEQQARKWQQQRGWLQPGGWKAYDSWQQGRAQRWSTDHRTWAQRGGYGGSYVPPDRFSLYFGSQHLFRLTTRPVMYLGYPRFEYNGISFLLVDPFPEYWAENWYALDDVYIGYDDGYYLFNRSYPQVKLAIAIAL